MTSIIRISYLNTFEVDHTCELIVELLHLCILYQANSRVLYPRVNGQCYELVLC